MNSDEMNLSHDVVTTADRPRLWPAAIILLVQFISLGVTVTPSIGNGPRFGFMMLGPATCVLLFAVWLLLASRLRWRDRFAIFVLAILCGLLMGELVDSTIRISLWIYGVPLAMLLVTAGLWLGRDWTATPRTWMVIATVFLGWSVFSLARMEGIDGSYWPEYRWRWNPTERAYTAAETSS